MGGWSGGLHPNYQATLWQTCMLKTSKISTQVKVYLLIRNYLDRMRLKLDCCVLRRCLSKYIITGIQGKPQALYTGETSSLGYRENLRHRIQGKPQA